MQPCAFKKGTKRRNLSVRILNKIMNFLNQMRWSRVIWTRFLLNINHFVFDKNRQVISFGFERILTYLLTCISTYILTYLLPSFLPSFLRYLLTYLRRPWGRNPLENLTGFQLVKKFPAFYGTRRFITAFTSSHHLPLSWATWIQSMPPNPTSWRSILIVSSHLCPCLPLNLIYILLIPWLLL